MGRDANENSEKSHYETCGDSAPINREISFQQQLIESLCNTMMGFAEILFIRDKRNKSLRNENAFPYIIPSHLYYSPAASTRIAIRH